MKEEQTVAATDSFFTYIKSELHIADKADNYDLLPDETTGVFRTSSFGLDTSDPANRRSSANLKWFAIETSILVFQGVSAETSAKASAKVSGFISTIPNIIAGFSRYPTNCEGFHSIAWDERKIVPVPSSPLYNQIEHPRWIVQFVFGAVLYFCQKTTPQGIYR